MALCKYPKFVTGSSDAAFDKIHTPGSVTPHSGIYRCEHCGHEVASNAGNPLPPQNHHQHGTTQGTIQWRMVVLAQTK
jgi:hypothetical protein